MNKPCLTYEQWKVFEGKDLIVFWELKVNTQIKSFVGRVKNVKIVRDQDIVTSLGLTMSVCFEIEIKGDDTNPKPKSKRENIKTDFLEPRKMIHQMDTTVIHCSNGNLCISTDPDEQQMFLDLEQEYADKERPYLHITPS